jgi:CRISPR/Cas system endoribonuclease Cas6 (RAMP superfamily)
MTTKKVTPVLFKESKVPMNLPPKERVRKSRTTRIEAGSLRLDVMVSDGITQKLFELMDIWQFQKRKDAIQYAIEIAYERELRLRERKMKKQERED